MADEPLTVSFTIAKDDVWIDPDGVSWYIQSTGVQTVSVTRKVVAQVDARELVRKWRKMGDPA